ncbi:unnamed protein product [Microthlaspi erraticum]|uniref:Uncharacterized protein n=1 Tax=Microthlaspi erraticum TaxID=1685480 RepID=A0A6D2HWH4_9BRAS|nr:unnamed protein product [Microthlaspi erraticum]
MDFIKTSSLRALIELTFQRNWNGFIWMSRKGVIAKRVKAAPDSISRISVRTRSPAGRGTNVPRSAKTVFRPTEVSAKVQPSADHATRPGKHCPAVGQASTFHATPRTTMRASRETRPRGRATRSRTTADASVRAGKERPTSGRETIGQIYPPDQPADHETIRPRPFRLGQDPTVRPIVPTDRPNAAVDPKPFLKPNPHNSSPKPAPT